VVQRYAIFPEQAFNDDYLRFKMRDLAIFQPKITIFKPFSPPFADFQLKNIAF